MRIGINCLSIIPNRIGGGETYLVNLLQQLAQIDKRNQYLLLVNPCNEHLFVLDQDNFSVILCPAFTGNPLWRVKFEQTIVPFIVRAKKIGLLHSPGNIGPVLLSVPSVLTIQYLTDFKKASSVPLTPQWALLGVLTKLSIQRAARVIAISHNVKREVLSFTNVPEDKVVTVYYGGASSAFFKRVPLSQLSVFRREHAVEDGYILSVSTTHPWKNVTGAIAAYGRLTAEYGIDQKLVHAGLQGVGHADVIRVVDDLGLKDKVVLLGSVEHHSMPTLYQGASLLIFPSFGETFGLPIVEAMACGVPVVASNAPAIPEIAGNAAILIDPHDVEGMAEAMYLVLTKPSLRRDLIQRGLERARAFSWEEAARKTLAVYEETYLSGS